jgi:hypothetical protein
LPQVQAHSASFTLVQPEGQQPSPEAQVVCAPSSTQRAVHAAAVPVSFCRVQPTAGQLAGHVPGGSQASPASITPLPHAALQSLSLLALQPGGQQPSALTQAVCMPSLTHWAWQVPGLANRRSMQPVGAQDVGQVDSGSHVSPHPDSIVPLPQLQLQSLSSAAVQAEGQQPSPDTHLVSRPFCTQTALQVAAAPFS